MRRIHPRVITFCVLALTVLGCGNSSSSTPSETGLTNVQRTWCSEHADAHAEAASSLGIPFIGDYIRASSETAGPEFTDLEPPFLAIPSGNDESLTYRLQFENRDDFDRACQVAIDTFD
ncbi:MAG: hypothetical protein ACJZ57_06645 [Candidatus Poriferisodalaceae bacterium]